MPPLGLVGDLDCDVVVDMDIKLSAGDTVPECIRVLSMGALDCDLAVEGLAVGGRIGFLLEARPLACRGIPAILQGFLSTMSDRERLRWENSGPALFTGKTEDVNNAGSFRVPSLYVIVQLSFAHLPKTCDRQTMTRDRP